ncbi:hypothetical protein [Actinoallomurus sp. NPDC052274]|uniref:hypothetical protein n=1 Tax=Actinoallomurus sp. NPDC052274 TaxID=3155420 RepID=UPI003438ED1B
MDALAELMLRLDGRFILLCHEDGWLFTIHCKSCDDEPLGRLRLRKETPLPEVLRQLITLAAEHLPRCPSTPGSRSDGDQHQRAVSEK